MLRSLTIENYALIDHLEIEFPDGLIIITGETGAGKSILLGALSLLLGGKSDISMVGNTLKNCVVEGEFDLSSMENLHDMPEQVIIRRVLTPAGRSRAFVNDEPVSLSSLNEMAAHLVDIHAQHNHLLLNNEAYQLSILDHFADCGKLLENYRNAYYKYKEAETSLKNLNERIAKAKEEEEYKRYQLEKLEKAALAEGELEELTAEHDRLANAEQISEGISSALHLFQTEEFSMVQNLKEASQILRKYYTFVPEFEELAERIESCRIECKDIEDELEERSAAIVSSPERLQVVEERVAYIEELMRRYGAETVPALINYRDELRSEIDGYALDESEREGLEKRVKSLLAGRNEAAKVLSRSRSKGAETLAKVLTEKLHRLEMPNARFGIEIEQSDSYNENGADNIRFLFSANAGAKVQEICKAASGGELSRIMLSLKEIMAQYTKMPTMIFDEIDTGVSGSIADKMGELIGEMGRNMQVIAITHLPQIAVKGSTHYKVYKEVSDGKTVSRIKQLSKEERIMEIARMLSGSQLSQAAIENAKFLLK